MNFLFKNREKEIPEIKNAKMKFVKLFEFCITANNQEKLNNSLKIDRGVCDDCKLKTDKLISEKKELQVKLQKYKNMNQ